MLISRLSKAQYVIFLGTTFQSHSTSSAIKRLGENQTFWITALGWCQSSFYLIYCQLGQHLSSLMLWMAYVNDKPFSSRSETLSCEIQNRSWNVLETYLDLQRFTQQLNLCFVDFARLCAIAFCWHLFLIVSVSIWKLLLWWWTLFASYKSLLLKSLSKSERSFCPGFRQFERRLNGSNCFLRGMTYFWSSR